MGLICEFGFLKKSCVVDFICPSYPPLQAGCAVWMADLPYLLVDASLDLSMKAYLDTLKPFVARPKIFLASFWLEKHSLVTGVYPFA